jgi:hypothetical protein
MTFLGLSLGLILLLALVLFALLLWVPPEDAQRSARRRIQLYVFISTVVLAITVYYYFGFRKHGSPLLSERDQMRFEHVGYYQGLGQGAFVLSGSAQGNQVYHPALGDNETIELRPTWTEGSEVEKWRMDCKCPRGALRVNGVISNVPDDRWLSPGDTLYVYRRDGTRTKFFSLLWEKSDAKERFLFGQGEQSAGIRIYDPDDSRLLLSKRVYQNSRDMATMIRHASKEFTNTIGSIDSGWWEIWEGITFVRERIFDSSSRLGLLLTPEFLADGGLAIYKNSQRISAANQLVSMELRPGDALSYGSVDRKQLSMELPLRTIEDPVWHNVVEFKLIRRPRWTLPPISNEPFLITSSTDYIPLSSLWIDIGKTSHNFYAKGQVDDDAKTININDGRRQKPYPAENLIRLGDEQQGAIVRLAPLDQQIPWPGVLALAELCLLAATFIIALGRDRRNKAHLDVAFAVLWVFAVTLLIVRLILTWRVALLPPENATYREITNLFQRGFRNALLALFVLPLALILIRFVFCAERPNFFKRLAGAIAFGLEWIFVWSFVRPLSMLSRLLRLGRRNADDEDSDHWLRWSIVVAWFAVTLLWILLGRFRGDGERFIGLRITAITHLLLLVGVFVCSRVVHATRTRREWRILTLLFTLILMGMISLLVLVIGDGGAIIYAAPILAAAWLQFCFTSVKADAWKATLSAFIAISTLVIPYSYVKRLPVILAVNPTVQYRLAVKTHTEEALLMSRTDEGNVNVDLLLRTMLQNWQTQLYATHGVTHPEGFGRAPFSRVGMSYPVAMTDAVFAMFLVSEHGLWAGWFLLLIHLGICFACFYASWHLPRQYEYRIEPLTAIGSFFAYNALYMAASCIGLLVFTGQNVPLLSLISGSDLLQSGLALCGATIMLAGNVSTAESDLPRRHRALLYASRFFFVALCIWACVILMRMFEIKNDTALRADHNLSTDLLKTLREHLPDLSRNSCWSINDKDPKKDVIVERRHCDASEIEVQYMNQLNERANKFDPNGGLYYLESVSPEIATGGLRVRINQNYLRRRSPFRPAGLWQGEIVSGGGAEDLMISGVGSGFAITMAQSGYAESVALSSSNGRHTNKRVAIKEDDRPEATIFFELTRDQDGLYLIPRRDSHPNPRWSVWIDGSREPVKARQRLTEHALIALDVHQGSLTRRHTFIYLGKQPDVVAYVKWVNGGVRRVFPQGNVLPMAYELGETADIAHTLGSDVPKRLTLTIDLGLQSKLQTILNEFAASHMEAYGANDPRLSHRLALTVLDAHTGSVLALPSWPFKDPNEADFMQSVLESTPGEQERLLKNHNLINHAIGSTVKPFVFAAVAAGLEGEVDVGRIQVRNRPSPVPEQAGRTLIHPHTELAGIKLASPWDCMSSADPIDNERFLPDSRNYYEALIGMMGLFVQPESWRRAWVPATEGSETLVYNGQRYRFDLSLLPPEELVFTRDDVPRPLAELLAKSLLVRKLPELFRVVTGTPQPFSLQNCRQFLPALCPDTGDGATLENWALNNVVPATVEIDPAQFQTSLDLVRYFIGAGLCRWNNVGTAESFARLLTGQKVSAHLQQTLSPQKLDSMPKPVSSPTWRNLRLLGPLQKAVENGTARELLGKVPQPYRLLVKTGTIDASAAGRENESMLLAIGELGDNGVWHGQSLVCSLYMEASKGRNSLMTKFELADTLRQALVNHLKANKN